MVNSDDFAKRIQMLMDKHQLSASTFADKIGVQRSSISHILSGRNKPSLDFILKITSEFKDVDLYWLVNGKGNLSNQINEQDKNIASFLPFNETIYQKQVTKIMVFYTDGTFDEFKKF